MRKWSKDLTLLKYVFNQLHSLTFPSIISIGIFIQSCSVQVKDSYSKSAYKPNINKEIRENVSKKENNQTKEKETVEKKENSDVNNEILSIISQDDEKFIKRKASMLNIQIPNDKDIDNFIIYFTTTKKYFTENALKRANYFMPMAKQIFRQEGLPEELVYLAVIESGFNPFATSVSNAAGIWQFIPSTGKRFGLRIDDYIDERRDPYKSTIAAAEYLKFLYNMFGSWELAIASYNCGEKCISKRLDSLSATSFPEIKDALPAETKEYVPRFFAVLLIAKNPERYGLNVRSNVYDVINFTADREITLSDLAQEKKVDYDVLKFYNAHLRKGIALEGTNINIPKLDYASTFDRRFIALQPAKKHATKPAIVKTSQIVFKDKNYGTNKGSDTIVSLIEKSNKPDVIETSYKLSNKKNIYIVQKGDTLFSIAKKFGISVDILKRANNLKDDNVKIMQSLLIPTNKS